MKSPGCEGRRATLRDEVLGGRRDLMLRCRRGMLE